MMYLYQKVQLVFSSSIYQANAVSLCLPTHAFVNKKAIKPMNTPETGTHAIFFFTYSLTHTETRQKKYNDRLLLLLKKWSCLFLQLETYSSILYLSNYANYDKTAK